ncbi:MAG: hypothetical protein A2W25_14525 [candidate division Zixibacteria bacterium RBG_16_53_22]|nr:MAG: hypothetical protein A2W25_14525 [candidate division Zixibacteria bacterium RBG_16_53_22]
MHNKHLINFGFYLLLVFAFTAAIYPPLAYFAAAGLLLLWLLDLLIFREPEFVNMPLFYPMMALVAILVVAWMVARIYGAGNNFVYIAFLSLFYFIVGGFVVTNEQRRMIMWTFASGVLLYSGIRLAVWWGALSQPGHEMIHVDQSRILFISMAICILIAFLAEAKGKYERIFYSLVCLPLTILALMISDRSVILAILVIVVFVAIFRDKRLMIPVAAIILLAALGLGGIHFYLERNLNIAGCGKFIMAPLNSAFYDPDIISEASFFGANITAPDYNMNPGYMYSFFLELIRGAGPPAVLIMTYIFFERARESYSKRKKVALSEEKSYHLTVLLVVGVLIVLNIYGTAFFFPNAVLAAWMILGIGEV